LLVFTKKNKNNKLDLIKKTEDKYNKK